MKLKSIFRLYKIYYPSSTPHRVTIAGGGAVQVSDRRRVARLEVSPASVIPRLLPPTTDTTLPSEPETSALMREFCTDNRRELFMMNETRNLYGIVYAENFTSDLSLMSYALHGSLQTQRTCGLRLTWLFALADKMTHNRYSLASVTLERCGNAYFTAATPTENIFVRVSAGAQVLRLGLDGGKTTDDGEQLRYARMFCRDNAAWFSAFAAGKEESL